MNPRRIKEKSKALSWLLRHGAREADLPMDEAGWAPIADVMRFVGLDATMLAVVVAQNDKQRLQVRGDHIRACQGHSRGVPVTLEGLERTWGRFEGGPWVWHGTMLTALDSIAHGGLLPIDRTHVHLTADPRSRVGKRSLAQVLLAVSTDSMRAAGLGLWQAPNGVILTRHVPPEHIRGAVAEGKKALSVARRGEGPFAWWSAADRPTPAPAQPKCTADT